VALFYGISWALSLGVMAYVVALLAFIVAARSPGLKNAR
jgi:hypothetical protein